MINVKMKAKNVALWGFATAAFFAGGFRECFAAQQLMSNDRDFDMKCNAKSGEVEITNKRNPLRQFVIYSGTGYVVDASSLKGSQALKESAFNKGTAGTGWEIPAFTVVHGGPSDVRFTCRDFTAPFLVRYQIEEKKDEWKWRVYLQTPEALEYVFGRPPR